MTFTSVAVVKYELKKKWDPWTRVLARVAHCSVCGLVNITTVFFHLNHGSYSIPTAGPLQGRARERITGGYWC